MRSNSNSGDVAVAENAGEKAKEYAKQYVDMGVEAYKTASDQARVMSRKADAYVRENPWMIIGTAAGIGLLLGLLIRRK
jgi:ElaB/YqjD/DUF883 family membrane-anchored ribosome-binding protein